MTAAQVVIVVRLLAGLYAVDAGLLDCIIYRESSYNVDARNGIHIGVAQYNPDTLVWLGEKALDDPLFLHRHMAIDATEPVYSIALLAWAVRGGYGPHWSVWDICGGEG